MRLAGPVAHILMVIRTQACNIIVRKPKERRQPKDNEVARTKILTRNLSNT